MTAASVLTMVLASLCTSAAVLGICVWWVPLLLNFTQRPVQKHLLRAVELGYQEPFLRSRIAIADLVGATIIAGIAIGWLGSVIGLTLAFIGIHLRSQVIRTIVERREATLRGQVLKFTNGLDAYTRSGMGLAEAIESTARETDAPLGVFVNRISRDARRGRPLVEALNAVRSSMRLEPFSLLATAITCSLRQGSSLSASLAGVQQSLEDRMNVERLMYSKTSSTRRSMLILGLSPIGFLVLFSFSMSSQMTMLLTHNLGKAFLAAIILLMYTGIAWMQRILVVRD